MIYVRPGALGLLKLPVLRLHSKEPLALGPELIQFRKGEKPREAAHFLDQAHPQGSLSITLFR